MSKNQDGLEAGQPVDFETLMRVKANQRSNKHAKPSAEPAKRGRQKKDDRRNEPKVYDSSYAVGAEEA